MSKLKHTPGPWEIINSEEHEIYNGNYYKIQTEKPFYNDMENKGFSICTFMSESDARLIAAAPEMLEALIYSYRLIKSTGLSIPQISEIIERATGLKIEEVLNEN